jgi:hypothetical protein
MGRYSRSIVHPDDSKQKDAVHPIWRGIGFVFMILIPAMAFGIMTLLIQENIKAGWVQIPRDLLWVEFKADPQILVKIGLWLVITIIGYAVFTLIYFIVMRIVSPNTYNPYKAPPVIYRGKTSSRR